MVSRKCPITPEIEQSLWKENIFSLDCSQGLSRAIVFYTIKGFGIFLGKDLKLLQTHHVYFGEDSYGPFVRLDVRPYHHGRLIKRYDDPANPRSLYKIFKKYSGYLANEGPFLVRPITSIKDYIIYSPGPLGVMTMDEMVAVIMEDLGLRDQTYGNISVALLAIDMLRSFGVGSHCLQQWALPFLSVYMKVYKDEFKECTELNCEEKSDSVCLMISRLLDPPYPWEIRSSDTPVIRKLLTSNKNELPRKSKSLDKKEQKMVEEKEFAPIKIEVVSDDEEKIQVPAKKNSQRKVDRMHLIKKKIRHKIMNGAKPNVSYSNFEDEKPVDESNIKNEEDIGMRNTFQSLLGSRRTVELSEKDHLSSDSANVCKMTSSEEKNNEGCPLESKPHEEKCHPKGVKRELNENGRNSPCQKKLKHKDTEGSEVGEDSMLSTENVQLRVKDETEDDLPVWFEGAKAEQSETHFKTKLDRNFGDVQTSESDIKHQELENDTWGLENSSETLHGSANHIISNVEENIIRSAVKSTPSNKSKSSTSTESSLEVLRKLLQQTSEAKSPIPDLHRESPLIHENQSKETYEGSDDRVLLLDSYKDDSNTGFDLSPPCLSPQPVSVGSSSSPKPEVISDGGRSSSQAPEIVKFLDMAQSQMQNLLKSSLGHVASFDKSSENYLLEHVDNSPANLDMSASELSLSKFKNSSPVHCKKKLSSKKTVWPPKESEIGVSCDSKKTESSEHDEDTNSASGNGSYLNCPLLRSVLQGHGAPFEQGSPGSTKSVVTSSGHSEDSVHSPSTPKISESEMESRDGSKASGITKCCCSNENSRSANAKSCPYSCVRSHSTDANQTSCSDLTENECIKKINDQPSSSKSSPSPSLPMFSSSKSLLSTLLTSPLVPVHNNVSGEITVSGSNKSSHSPPSTSDKSSGLYHYSSNHSDKVIYQNLHVSSNQNSQTFSMADVPWCPGTPSESEKLGRQGSSKPVVTSEICLADYLPVGAMISANSLRLLTQQTTDGMEVALKFDFSSCSPEENVEHAIEEDDDEDEIVERVV